MRHLFLTIILTAGIFQFAEAQDTSADDGLTLRERIARREAAAVKQQQKGLPELSVRAENMNESQTQDISNVPWMREFIRFLDLNEDKNASLYYPEQPIGDRMNLFTMMFKLLQGEDVVAYQYIGDQEDFTDKNKLKFKDLLDRFSIMYMEENGEYVVDNTDIPNNEILGYFVKEAWYFDQSNSVVDVKILALCPVLIRQDDFDAESTRYPLFWMPYENIRPYAARMPIMTSNLNNASTQTVDDYFRKRSFEGEIIKTTNMRNRTLQQMFPTDSLLKKEQKRIEGELVQFKNNLWIIENNTQVVSAKEDTKKKEESTEDNDKTSKNTVPVRTNEKKVQKTTKAQKSSAPARSMRGRRTK